MFSHTVLCLILCAMTHASDVLVTVQSQDVSAMNQLTADILTENQNTTSTMRVTLGAIEATMSRVVDSNDAYTQVQVQAQPSLTLLNSITFDETTQSWSFEYSTMQTSDEHNINRYHRILYFSKNTVEIFNSDLSNPCLASMDKTQCIEDMKQTYILSSTADKNADYFDVDTIPGIDISISNTAGSKLQILRINIPHHIIRSDLAKRSDITHPIDGDRVQWVFGIGMLFVPYDEDTSAIVIYDRFQLVEVSNSLLQVSQVTSYSIAEHVSFWTQQAIHDPTIYIATIEFLLAPNHILDNVDMTVNGVSLSRDICSDMQHKILSLNVSACITRYQLCSPVIYTSADNQQWATLVLPIPAQIASEAEKSINLLMQTNYTVNGNKRQVISSMNLASRQPPQQACEEAHVSFFSPVDFTEVMIYRGQSLALQAQSSSFTVDSNTIINSSDASSMISALLTIVIQPRNTQSAIDYFNTFTQENIKLDDLYMSHALDASTFETEFQNKIQTISGGRSNLVLDPSLLSLCPQESDPSFVYADSLFTCVTTHDWNLDASVSRPFSSPSQPFVYEVSQNQEQDIAWLTSYVTGTSATGTTLATHIHSALMDKMVPRSKAYWVHPLYAWPDRSPVGLKDTTLVSLAWSLTYSQSITSRRLLSVGSDFKKIAKKKKQTVRYFKKQNKPIVQPIRQNLFFTNAIPPLYFSNRRPLLKSRLHDIAERK